jgi:GntR family transcriptional regulator, transcriptional repressor for pyruvate dehydrogenase complex
MTDPLVHLMQGHPSTVDDILELRHALESVAAYFAAQLVTDADAKRLCDLAAAIKRRRSVRDSLEDADLDLDFHMAVAEASHNLALLHVTRGIFDLMRINVLHAREALHHDRDNAILLDERHGEIVRAIVARDSAAARAAANLHLRFLQTSLREAAAATVRKRTTAVRKTKR